MHKHATVFKLSKPVVVDERTSGGSDSPGEGKEGRGGKEKFAEGVKSTTELCEI